MIKLIIKGKEKLFSNKEGIKILRKSNLKEKFKIAKCESTGKMTIMQYEKDYLESNGRPNWLCLHD